MINYNTQFDPPAITLPIVVAGVVHNRPQIEITALIDSGSDITAIPDVLLDKLKLYPFGRLQLEDASAVTTPVFTYAVRIAMVGDAAKEIEVVLTPFSFAILGRDWLRDYYLLLDGPNQQFLLSSVPFLLE